MIQPEPQSTGLSSLLNDIESGRIKIPQFQRQYVWERKAAAQLLDSIAKGFPIGTFILWETQEELRSIRNIGNHNLPETPTGHVAQYILDGQQRITSLYTCFKGLKISRNSKVEDFAQIYVDLEASEDEDIVTLNYEEENPKRYVAITDLLYGKMSVLVRQYSEEGLDKIDLYKERFKSYQFSLVILKNASLDVATDVFTRLNVGGKTLTLFEVMVAKTYDSSQDFDLSEKFDQLIEEIGEDFKTISSSTILQVISLILKKDCTRKQILRLEKQMFIDTWESVTVAIKKAIDYFKNYYGIPVSKILPYDALIVPFAYFFYYHPDRPLDQKREYLQDFFWRVSLTERYSSGVETKLGKDIRRIETILNGDLPSYDFEVNISTDRIIDQGWFSISRSFIKAILCLYASKGPRSFADNSRVHIDNAWLQIATSKNYHHFFPKAYLKSRNEDEFYINHILNITIVDDYLNKRVIRAKAPSIYMSDFKKKNSNLDETMSTHFIDPDTFGVWDDDYDLFFSKRAETISDELRGKLIIKEKTHPEKA
ncbi:hypothetical protein SAMN05421503_0278 [Terribacillus aidingensis]|uniref:GmrSD restriction endonucleases N-terminal domain-containing protein n=1 Tax=Terribacillus aidingensis TaxID=586416 RepID=A0A285N0Z2_9BACI|nr:DUF262 domain-containing protein [Terribacillus aidingensis]SNZ03112.1 hypothetical protein SAMN05421503_0278 [Terribacillus aidingensis]